jgi:two-component system OmpR family sensor kinase
VKTQIIVARVFPVMDGLSGELASGWVSSDTEPADVDGHHATLRSIVLDVSTTLMSAEPDELDTKIEWSLGTVGEHIGADRGYTVESRGDAFSVTAEWTADDIDPRQSRHFDLDAHEWLVDRLEGFENVPVPAVGELPAGPTRRHLRDAGVQSAVFLPMVDSWSLVGFVGFETLTADPKWRGPEVSTLRTAADVVTHSRARVRRERELAAQNERLEAFASVVSHDLRNPLNVVTGSIEIAQAETDSDHLDRAARAADRMDELIDQVLTLAREAEDISDTRAVRLAHIANLAWDAVDTAAADLRVEGDLGVVDADPDRLQEGFANLFRNAVEHAGEDVVVRVGRSDDGFYVADDGPGIPESERDAVFDRGHTSDGGTGLGLAIVRSIVEAHGWEVRITDAEGGGARFDVTGVVE